MPSMVGVIADSYNKPASGGPTLPVAGALLWFEASDASNFVLTGTTVDVWNNIAGAANDLYGSAAGRPIRNGTQNGLATVVFDGSDDNLFDYYGASPVTTATDNITMFVACRRTGGDINYSVVFHVGNFGANGYGLAFRASGPNIGVLFGGIAWHASTMPAPTVPVVAVLQRKAGTWSLYVGGVKTSLNNTNAPATPSTGLTIVNSSHMWGGAIYECIFYATALSDTDRQTVEDYLIYKWGLISKVWDGTTPASTVDTGRYNLGTFFSLFYPIIVRGVRIWNPGLVNTQTTYGEDRVANLWTHNGTGGSAVLRASVNIPDQLPAGWSEYLFSTPYAAPTGVNYCISYSCHGSGSNADYGAVNSALSSNFDRTPVRYEINGGVYIVAAPGAACPNGTGTTFYGVDILYT